MRANVFILTIVFIAALTSACGNRGTAATSPPTAPSDSIGSGQPASGTCNAAKAQWAIGQRASSDLLERARNAAEAKVARFLRPNEAITLEFSPVRLNLGLDQKNVVTSVTCG
jgi:Peptidase inhibitor I78 family